VAEGTPIWRSALNRIRISASETDEPPSIGKRIEHLLRERSIFGKYPFNLYLSMLQEVLLSCSGKSIERLLSEDWPAQALAKKELSHLLQHYDLSSIEKVIVVGSGAVPYTALFFRKHLKKHTYCIERNVICYLACLRLLRKLKEDTIIVVRGTGESYHDYENSLVIITKETRQKQEVIDRIGNGANTVVIRQPIKEETGRAEVIKVRNQRCAVVKQNYGNPSVSLVFSTRRKFG
jgi:hypothetical protein